MSAAQDPHSARHAAISAHVERHAGPIAAVWHETDVGELHTDILVVAPTDRRPTWILVTSGTSARPMTVLPGREGPARMELAIELPAAWLSGTGLEQLADERVGWPVAMLRAVSKYPHLFQTFLGQGDTVSAHLPPRPVASDAAYTAAMLVAPPLDDVAFRTVAGPDGEIALVGLAPLYEEERAYAMEHGARALMNGLFFVCLGKPQRIAKSRPTAMLITDPSRPESERDLKAFEALFPQDWDAARKRLILTENVLRDDLVLGLLRFRAIVALHPSFQNAALQHLAAGFKAIGHPETGEAWRKRALAQARQTVGETRTERAPSAKPAPTAPRAPKQADPIGRLGGVLIVMIVIVVALIGWMIT
jgi:hypothetical protein